MNTGKVKFFNVSKGFGFIINDEDDEEVFVHASALPAGVKLKEADRVEFNIEQGRRGLNATNVKVI